MTTAPAHRRIGDTRALPALLVQLAWVLAVAVALEFTLLRTLSRTALHIPDLEAAKAVYTVGSDLGRYAYFVALASLGATLGTVTFRSWGRRDSLAFAILLVVGVYAAVLALTPGDTAPPAITGALSVGAVFVAAAVATVSNRRLLPLALLVAVAFAASTAWNLLQSVAANDGTALRWTTEFAALGAAFVLPLSVSANMDRTSKLAGAVAGILMLGYLTTNPSTAGILLLWNGGLAGVLPGVFYAAALGVIVAVVVALARSGRQSLIPALVLLVCAGATLQNTYQTGLLVGAFLLLALLLSADPTPAPRHSENDGI